MAVQTDSFATVGFVSERLAKISAAAIDTVRFDLPPVTSAASAGEAAAALLAAASRGELTLGEANLMLQLVDGYCRTIVASDFELRLSKLEEATR